MTTKEAIILTIKDSVTNFLYYDREEDDTLSLDDIEEAINAGDITKEEIVNVFKEELYEMLND